MTAVANPQLMMPSSIPSDFAAPFAGLAADIGALPIDIAGVARIGVLGPDRRPLPPYPARPPLIAIDGSPRSADAPRPEPEGSRSRRAGGFEPDLGLMHDLLDMHPRNFFKLFNLPAPNSDWTERTSPHRNYASIREMLASDEGAASGLIYFENGVDRGGAGGARPSRIPPPPDRPLVEKPGFFEFAMQRFLHGALLARTGSDAQLLKAEGMLIQSAALFAKSERFCAAAMMLELAEEIQIRTGRPCDATRSEKAKRWLDAMSLDHDAGFKVIHDRALNAVQHEPAGSGTLKGIIRISMGHHRDSGDREELARTLIRHAWTTLMEAENPKTPLDGMDWLDVRNDLVVLEDHMKGDGDSAHAEVAGSLERMALGFADEVTAEEKKKGDSPA
jgi:hypothetical protein